MKVAGGFALRATSWSVSLFPRAYVPLRGAVSNLPPRLRRHLAIVLAAVLALAVGYVFWFRDSSFVAVDEVYVSGLTTEDAERVRYVLGNAADDMTTLHVREDELMRAVEGFPAIRAVEASPDFPHELRIRVIEHRPTAILAVGDKRLPIGADGTVLEGLTPDGQLPVLRAERLPAGRRVSDEGTQRFVRLLGAAPPALLERIEGVRRDRRRGIVVELRRGPQLFFGSLDRLDAKWLAAARVLADPGAKGARYVDVRIPERPAAGGLGAATIAPSPPAGAPVPDQAAPPASAPPPAATPQAAPEPPAAQGGGAGTGAVPPD